MFARPDTPEAPPHADEVNRLWQHGMHEERLFHDRMNFFSAMQVGLLGVFAILYNKEPALGVFVPLIVVALAFTLLWLVVQVRHWRYCVHVHVHVRRAVPEYGRTVASFAGPGRTDGLSIARPLAFAVPLLFASIWVALLAWALIRSGGSTAGDRVASSRLLDPVREARDLPSYRLVGSCRCPRRDLDVGGRGAAPGRAI